MSVCLQIRRDTAANWEQLNPVLLSGEFGYDETNKSIKIGDGVTPWNALPPLCGQCPPVSSSSLFSSSSSAENGSSNSSNDFSSLTVSSDSFGTSSGSNTVIEGAWRVTGEFQTRYACADNCAPVTAFAPTGAYFVQNATPEKTFDDVQAALQALYNDPQVQQALIFSLAVPYGIPWQPPAWFNVNTNYDTREAALLANDSLFWMPDQSVTWIRGARAADCANDSACNFIDSSTSSGTTGAWKWEFISETKYVCVNGACVAITNLFSKTNGFSPVFVPGATPDFTEQEVSNSFGPPPRFLANGNINTTFSTQLAAMRAALWFQTLGPANWGAAFADFSACVNAGGTYSYLECISPYAGADPCFARATVPTMVVRPCCGSCSSSSSANSSNRSSESSADQYYCVRDKSSSNSGSSDSASSDSDNSAVSSSSSSSMYYGPCGYTAWPGSMYVKINFGGAFGSGNCQCNNNFIYNQTFALRPVVVSTTYARYQLVDPGTCGSGFAEGLLEFSCANGGGWDAVLAAEIMCTQNGFGKNFTANFHVDNPMTISGLAIGGPVSCQSGPCTDAEITSFAPI